MMAVIAWALIASGSVVACFIALGIAINGAPRVIWIEDTGYSWRIMFTPLYPILALAFAAIAAGIELL